MLFYDTGRKSGEVPIYISGKRNIRISTVGQVHFGIIYALSGSKERSCKYRGAGGRLYRALESLLAEMGVLNLNACIAVPQKEDEYLTNASVDFHKHFGYKRVGMFHRCGYKFNRWYHMVWMEKMIGEHKSVQPEVKPFPEIQDKICFDRFSW